MPGGSSYSAGAIVLGDLRAQTEALTDQQGRVYESRVYEVTVNPTTGEGAAGDYLATDTWYDPRGYVAKTVTGAGAFQKFTYDGAGRLAASYVSYDADENQTDYSAAMSVAGDTVIEQTQDWYDANGQLVAMATFQRLPDDTSSTGALTADIAYVSASAMWYDAAGRVTHQVDYGRQDAIASVATDFFDEYGDLIDSREGKGDITEIGAREKKRGHHCSVEKSCMEDHDVERDGS